MASRRSTPTGMSASSIAGDGEPTSLDFSATTPRRHCRRSTAGPATTPSPDPGADRIVGGEGADVIVGGDGGDILSGGIGADVFTFSYASETGDTIIDFHRGEDILSFLAFRRRYGDVRAATPDLRRSATAGSGGQRHHLAADRRCDDDPGRCERGHDGRFHDRSEWARQPLAERLPPLRPEGWGGAGAPSSAPDPRISASLRPRMTGLGMASSSGERERDPRTSGRHERLILHPILGSPLTLRPRMTSGVLRSVRG